MSKPCLRLSVHCVSVGWLIFLHLVDNDVSDTNFLKPWQSRVKIVFENQWKQGCRRWDKDKFRWLTVAQNQTQYLSREGFLESERMQAVFLVPHCLHITKQGTYKTQVPWLCLQSVSGDPYLNILTFIRWIVVKLSADINGVQKLNLNYFTDALTLLVPLWD